MIAVGGLMKRVVTLLSLPLAVYGAACMKSAEQEFLDQGAKPLSAAEAKQVLAGNTLRGSIVATGSPIPFSVYLSADGRASAVAMDESDRGSWRTQSNGEVCLKWKTWQDGAESCNVYFRKGDVFKVFLPGGVLASSAMLSRGNPQKLELRTDQELALAKGEIVALSASEASTELSGNTFNGLLEQLNGSPLQVFYDPSGKLAGKRTGAVNDSDKGAWSIKPSGELCTKWNKWNDAAESCSVVYRRGKKLATYTAEGTPAVTGSMRSGNPGKLTP
jgi:hypothetical protein